MDNMKERINKFLKIDNPRELAESIPNRVVIILLACPAIIFIFSMAFELFKCLFLKENTYRYDRSWFIWDGVFIGLFAIVAYFFKLHYNGGQGKKVFKNPTMICFTAMIFLMFLSTLINGFTNTALTGDLYRGESLFIFIAYPAIYYFASSLIGSETAKRRIINGFLAVSFLIAAMTVLHIVAAEHGLTSLASFTAILGSNHVVAIYHQFNHYGYSLALAISLSGAMFVTEKKIPMQVFYLACFILCNIALIFNDTFGSYLAVFLMLLALILFYIIRDRKPKLKTFLLLGLFVVISLTVDFERVWANVSTLFADIFRVVGNIKGTVPSEEADRAGTSRWHIWKSTIKMIFERPFFGHGIDGIGDRLSAMSSCDRPHNEFLQYAAFFGIPTLLCYVGALISMFVSFLKRRLENSPCTVAAFAAAFAYLASSCFGNTMYYTAPFFFIFLGLSDARPPKLD